MLTTCCSYSKQFIGLIIPSMVHFTCTQYKDYKDKQLHRENDNVCGKRWVGGWVVGVCMKGRKHKQTRTLADRKQTNIIDKQANKHTNRDRQTNTQADKQTDRDRQTDRKADKQTATQTNRQTDRHTDRQTDRQTDRRSRKTKCSGVYQLLEQTLFGPTPKVQYERHL